MHHDVHYGGFIFVEVCDICQQIFLCYYLSESGFIHVFDERCLEIAIDSTG